MQAGAGAVAVLTTQRADELAGRDSVSDLHDRRDGLVGRPLPAVIDRDDRHAPDRPDERDAARRHGAHGPTDDAPQVDAAVTGSVPVGGRVEPLTDLPPVEGPRPGLPRRAGRRGDDEHGGGEDGEGEGESAAHAVSQRASRRPRQTCAPSWGEPLEDPQPVDFVPGGGVP